MQNLPGETRRIGSVPKLHFFQNVGPFLYPNSRLFGNQAKANLSVSLDVQHV